MIENSRKHLCMTISTHFREGCTSGGLTLADIRNCHHAPLLKGSPKSAKNVSNAPLESGLGWVDLCEALCRKYGKPVDWIKDVRYYLVSYEQLYHDLTCERLRIGHCGLYATQVGSHAILVGESNLGPARRSTSCIVCAS